MSEDEPTRDELADARQRECTFVMFRGAITGRLVTCGVCQACRDSEAIRSGVSR